MSAILRQLFRAKCLSSEEAMLEDIPKHSCTPDLSRTPPKASTGVLSADYRIVRASA